MECLRRGCLCGRSRKCCGWRGGISLRGLRSMCTARLLKWFPHVHDRQTNSPALLLPQPTEEQVHAGFLTICPAEPDGPPPQQIAHDNAVGMPLADGQLVDSDDLRSRCARPLQLLFHVLLVQRFNRLPVQMRFPSDIANRLRPTPTPHPNVEPLGEKESSAKPIQPFLLHFPATPTEDPPDFHLQVDPILSAGQVPNSPDPPVVKTPMSTAASTADSFFPDDAAG